MYLYIGIGCFILGTVIGYLVASQIKGYQYGW